MHASMFAHVSVLLHICGNSASVCFVREKERRLSLEGWRDFAGPVEIRALHLCPQASLCVCASV